MKVCQCPGLVDVLSETIFDEHWQHLLDSRCSQGHPCERVSCGGRRERDACEGVAARAARCCRRACCGNCGRSGLPGPPRPEYLPLLKLRVVGAREALAGLLNSHHMVLSETAQPLLCSLVSSE